MRVYIIFYGKAQGWAPENNTLIFEFKIHWWNGGTWTILCRIMSVTRSKLLLHAINYGFSTNYYIINHHKGYNNTILVTKHVVFE